ncbi:MAG: PQQ-binding-like beta-propeller repeat protein [Saprospiraceae bacterium]|nr:PQQ-binding-like beta-propeller repeat protein [Saprospiraceae bacterium]
MKLIPFYLISILFLITACHSTVSEYVNWSVYQGGKDSNQYSQLDEIDVSNASNLKVIWTYSSGDADTLKNRTQIQCNPLIIDGILYGSSPSLKFFALDASNGKEIWSFDPFAAEGYKQFGMGVNRGLAYWSDGSEKRLLVTAGSYLYSIDANTGKVDPQFGKAGKVDLHQGLDREVGDLFIVSNTPGIVFKELLILGSRVSESTGAAPGHIRAFNVKTGEQAWIFHTIPFPGEKGYESWPKNAWQYAGGANAWSGFSLDEERGIVYVPTGSAAWDFYGADRKGENLYANCLIALEAATGEHIWHYQFVKHDLWDRDLPAPPNLISIEKEGKKIDAVAQITKSAQIFVFDRETGEPIYPIIEEPVPPSKLEGEQAWPTQPVSSLPVFSRNRMKEEDITRRSPEAYAYVKAIWEKLDEGPHFIPPSENGAIILPGLDGGGEWGGAAFDESTGDLIVNASEMPWILQLLPHKATDNTPIGQGKQLYQSYCIACHGADLQGGDMFGAVPALANLKDRLAQPQIIATIQKGKGAMPSFEFLSEEQTQAIAAFLLELESEKNLEAILDKGSTYPYFFNGYKRFKDQDGYPALTPPWGTLNAVNLNTGTISWKVILGEYPALSKQGVKATGSESYGGPVVTAGGVVFMAGTIDEKFRVFDKSNGSLLWETQLPAAGFATPATYAIDGKQYVVIACGGGKLGQKSGDTYVAFAL